MGELSRLQKAFTEHLRDPGHVPVPAGLDERRMGIYSELIFNNVSSLLCDFFPVIRSILSDDAWRSMVRNFFISHQSQTPYFMALSGEFVEYLAQAQLSSELPGYLTELAHYEWVELALFTMDEEHPEPVDDDGLGTCHSGSAHWHSHWPTPTLFIESVRTFNREPRETRHLTFWFAESLTNL